MARYDYGLRGPRDTTDPRFHEWGGPEYYDQPGRSPRRIPPGTRVSDRYNRDYVQPSGERYPYNPYRYGGDGPRRLDSEYDYEQPYITRGGTWTYRGVPREGR